jgi:hypothetical protein
MMHPRLTSVMNKRCIARTVNHQLVCTHSGTRVINAAFGAFGGEWVGKVTAFGMSDSRFCVGKSSSNRLRMHMPARGMTDEPAGARV